MPPMLLLLLTACSSDKNTSAPADTGTDTLGTTPTDTTETLENRLANPGFELGESWQRPAGYVNHAWSATGDAIYNSTDTFTALEGTHAEKIWGFYSGTVPNDSEHFLALTDLTPGDTHTFTVEALTHEDDAVSGGSHAELFLRFTSSDGAVIAEHTSAVRIDADTERSTWIPLTVTADAPEGAAGGALGLRFHLADWSAGGAVYLDAASWTSTGTGRVDGERLLVWSDEFSGDTLDTDKWTHELLPAYTYNNELQTYTDRAENSALSDGQLVITARNESYEGAAYTSARLNTAGKGDWTYGRFEGMLQVPSGVGTWPALWMLPTDWAYGAWPDSGEIDIMEHVGCDPDVVHGTVHTGAYNHLLDTQQGGSTSTDATSSFHLYAVEWTADTMVFSLDNQPYFTFTNDGTGSADSWPFDQAFHFVVNLAVGGDWGGYCGVDSGAFPQEYRLDWVRVYQYP